MRALGLLQLMVRQLLAPYAVSRILAISARVQQKQILGLLQEMAQQLLKSGVVS